MSQEMRQMCGTDPRQMAGHCEPAPEKLSGLPLASGIVDAKRCGFLG